MLLLGANYQFLIKHNIFVIAIKNKQTKIKIMENLNKLLKKTLAKHYECESIINQITKDLKNQLEKQIKEKYLNVTYNNKNLDFKIFDVKINLCFYSLSDYNRKQSVKLLFTTISKLPKDKLLKLEKIKNEFIKDGYVFSSQCKIPFYYIFNFELTIEELISENYILNINI